MAVFAINLTETDTQFPGVRQQHDIAMLVNLSFTLTLCNYSSRCLRHFNFICAEREKKRSDLAGWDFLKTRRQVRGRRGGVS